MERFAVRTGITLTVEYGPDRIACQFLIAAEQALIELQTPIPTMSSKGVSDLLQEVLPAATKRKTNRLNHRRGPKPYAAED